jgi:hypothetical protein
MRRLLYITYFFALLLAVGNKMHANVHNITIASISKWNLLSKEQDQITILDHSYSLIEYSDFDLDEEFSHCDNHEDSKTNKLFQVKNSLLDKWYLSYGDSLDNPYYYNVFYNCKPIRGQSTPIYITNRVLRI